MRVAGAAAVLAEVAAATQTAAMMPTRLANTIAITN